MAFNAFGVKRLCGIVAVSIGISLIVAFILSEAWFGVMLALFITVVGMQVVMQPDRMLRSGADDVEENFQDRFSRRKED